MASAAQPAERPERGGSLIRQSFVAFASLLTTRFANLVGLVALAHLLSQAAYGIYGLAITAQGTLAVIAGSGGVGLAASKRLAESRSAAERREVVSAVLWCSLSMSLLVAAGFVLVGPIWARSVVGGRIAIAFTSLCGLIAISQLLSTVSAGILRGERRIGLYGLNNVAFAGFTTVGAIAFAAGGSLGALLGVVIGGAAAVAIGTQLAWSSVGRVMPIAAFKVPKARYRDIVAVGGPTLIAPLLYLPASLFSQSLLTIDHGPATLASLQVAQNVNTTILLVMQSVNIPLLPAISRRAGLGQIEGLAEFAGRAVRVSIMVAGPVALFVAFTARYTVPFVFGARYGASTVSVVFVMVAAACALGIAAVVQNILIARGQMRSFVISYLCDASILAVVAFVAVPRLGAVGGALAILCGGSARLVVASTLASLGRAATLGRARLMTGLLALAFVAGLIASRLGGVVRLPAEGLLLVGAVAILALALMPGDRDLIATRWRALLGRWRARRDPTAVDLAGQTVMDEESSVVFLPVLGRLAPMDDIAGVQALDEAGEAGDRTRLAEALAHSAYAVGDLLTQLVSRGTDVLYVADGQEPHGGAALGLAGTLAGRGLEVVLVDADPHGSLTMLMGLQGRAGLAERPSPLLSDLWHLCVPVEIDLGGGVRQLHLIPAGAGGHRSGPPSSVSRANEAAGDTGLALGLSDLADRVDAVVVNGSLPVTDHFSVLGLVAQRGAALLISRGPSPNLVEAERSLKRRGIRVLAIIDAEA